MALGELQLSDIDDAQIGRDMSLWSSRASTSAGVELENHEIVVLGMSRQWSGPLAVDHAVMADAIDVAPVKAALDRLNLGSDDASLVALLAKAEPGTSGRLRGSRHTMLTTATSPPPATLAPSWAACWQVLSGRRRSSSPAAQNIRGRTAAAPLPLLPDETEDDHERTRIRNAPGPKGTIAFRNGHDQDLRQLHGAGGCLDRRRGGLLHALLGEKRCGKIHLVKCIMGFYSADKGKVTLDGQEISIRSPRVMPAPMASAWFYQHFHAGALPDGGRKPCHFPRRRTSVINWVKERKALDAFMETMPSGCARCAGLLAFRR